MRPKPEIPMLAGMIEARRVCEGCEAGEGSKGGARGEGAREGGAVRGTAARAVRRASVCPVGADSGASGFLRRKATSRMLWGL